MPRNQTNALRRNANRTNPFALILLAALILIAAVGVIFYAVGYRCYFTSAVKYSGFVKNGQPTDGTVHYAEGISGKLTADSTTFYGTIVYNNGDVYEGELLGFLRHGKGKLSYVGGKTYVGDFDHDKMTGFGEITSETGDYYSGYLQDNKKSGMGKRVFPDGSYYYGNWENDKRNGTGMEQSADGGIFYGSFLDDKKNGNTEVTVALEDGSVYTGKCKYLFPNGDTYVGDYLNDRMNGNGTYTFAGGDSYTGAFSGDAFNGTGTYTFADGTVYTGVFVDGRIADDAEAGAAEATEATAGVTADAS